MPNNLELVRAFIAIELPSAIRMELAQLQEKLRRQFHCSAKWVACDSIHLTLHFFGKVPQARIENIKHTMIHAVTEQPPFNLSIGKLGIFPNQEQPHVLWIGINDRLSNLKSLHDKLMKLLCCSGLATRDKSFRPHMTLARIRNEASYSEKQSLIQTLSLAGLTSHSSFNVQDISLIHSQLTPNRPPLYTTLFRAGLLSS